jgi:hypothetical protein
MIRIAQFSDLHYSEKNLAEADRCFGFAVDEAIQRGAEVAVISGDSTDHALDVHSPAVERLARQVRRLADHCPVLKASETFALVESAHRALPSLVGRDVPFLRPAQPGPRERYPACTSPTHDTSLTTRAPLRRGAAPPNRWRTSTLA